MALSLKHLHTPPSSLYNVNNPGQNPFSSTSSSLIKRSSNSFTVGGFWNRNYRSSNGVKACLFNPIDEPILKEALKEPVAFMGGMLAGLLRLDLNDDPLKEWVTKTVEAAGITAEDIDVEGSKPEEEVPEQIEIE